MTVQELIDALNKVQDKTKPVLVGKGVELRINDFEMYLHIGEIDYE